MHLALWRLCATTLGVVCLHVNAYGAAAQIEHKIVAHNYAVARNAAHEAVLHAVSQAKQLADGDVWIEGAAQCRLPIESSAVFLKLDNKKEIKNMETLLPTVDQYLPQLQYWSVIYAWFQLTGRKISTIVSGTQEY